MKIITNGFKTELKTMGKEIDAKIIYTINGTTYTLGANELNLVRPYYEGGILKSVMKALEIDSNIDIPLETILECQFGIKVNGTYEYISYGNYIVKESEKKEDTNSYLLTCYDKMLYSMVDYEKLKYRNLFDKDNANVLNAYINASGVITSNSPDRTIWLPISPNTDYTFQMTQKALNTSTSADDVRITLFNTKPALGVSGTNVYSQTRTSATSDYNYIKTFNSGNNSYVAIKILNTSKSNYDETLATLLLEKGTNVTEYEPFGDIQYPISVRKYIDLLCFNIGLTFKNKNDDFTNYDKTLDKELYLDENGNSLNYTYRDVLDELAQVTASTICINENDDEVEIRYITNAGEETTNVSGTNLSIESEDTQVNKIELIGNTTQASTPTPSSPQEVKTVTGLQEIKAVGKNLMKMSLYNANNYVSQKLTLETGEYYVSYVGDNSSAIYLRKANGTTPINGTSVKERYNGTTLQFTISEKGNYYIQCYLGGGGFTNFSQAMLNKGTTGLPYEPYIEQVSEINLGKNLYEGSQDFSGTWEYGSSWETDSQTFNGCVVKKRAGSWNGINKTFPVVSGKTYTFSVYAKADESRNCGLYLSNTVTPNAVAISVTTEWRRYSITFTANSNSTIRPRIENQTNSSTNYTYIACFQLEYGSQATSYSEYFTPIELCKIGTYEDKIFKTSGKNLFDKDNANILNYYMTSTGTIGSSSADKVIYIKCKHNTKYTIQKILGSTGRLRIGTFTNIPVAGDTPNVFIDRNNQTSGTITSGSNDNYLVVQYFANDTNEQAILDSIQIEYGNTATDYEPYSNNEWYVKKAIGKVVLKGANTEEWTYAGTSTSGTYRLKNNDISALVIKPSANNVKIPLYSNYYKDATADATYLSTVGISIATNGGIYIYDSNYTTSDISLYKTWLSTHNTIVYYPLASPTYEKLNDTLQEELNSIRLLEGLNNIMSSVPIDLTYVSGIDTIDEEYFNEDNVNFGEIYGPVNTIILSRSAESDEIAQSIPSNLSDDEKVAIKISDNQIMNFDNRDEFLYGILTRLYGLRYVQNDYSSKGICYYDLCDRYRADIFGKSYYCVMLNDDVTIESGLSENVFTEIPDTAKTEYSNTTTTDRLERKTTLIVDKQVGEIRAEISTIDDQLNGANGVTSKLNAQGQTLDIWSKSFDGNGNVTALKTENEPDDPTQKTTYTFDKDGIRIGKSTDDYNSLQDNTGTFYYEKDTMIGKYTKDGSVQKDLALFGRYYYGIDEENFNVKDFSLKDANFVAQWYDNGTEEGFGHFWNGE